MKNIIIKTLNKTVLLPALVLIVLGACTADLEKTPTNVITNDDQYASLEGYKQSLASIFANLVYGPFLRYHWEMQEYTTDMAVSTWGDDNNLLYHELSWSPDTPALAFLYNDLLKIITQCNNFVIESSQANLDSRGFTGNDAEQVMQFQAEARFLRAYAFWVLMDAYGNPPFPTEENLGNSNPEQIQRADLFAWLETELMEIESRMAEPQANERGRPDKAAVWGLLSRMFLNAEIYTGIPHYSEAITYATKIMNSGYSLIPDYSWLMLGDNFKNGDEFIWVINYDSTFQTWYGTNFLSLGAAGVPQSINGMSGSWSAFRFTQQIPVLFPTFDTSIDQRAQFYTDGQELEVKNIKKSTDGFSAYKYRNVDRDGNPMPQNNTFGNLSDIDFPVFRLAEIYLIYAEAVLRGGSGGNQSQALDYINQIRGRAYDNDPSSTLGNITLSELTLDFILDERARELYWETHRRTDLIRFNKLTTGSYLWAWKGGVEAGTSVDPKYNLFPIPTPDILANPNLTQNPGY
ncbi:RagB/SusD family nutrient uptake outer membrane protein [Aestuariivivens sediminis]|uniref:RagB/SusD family nutrient uptake outer membrane protein n=1 Tax=Aestuariivivens sediminis TaxID=2913557 RepID=UPI001F56B73F|nr:RagB/SusD family nutrient uptake outer membrane protein [Aestuariivivens sediminis]